MRMKNPFLYMLFLMLVFAIQAKAGYILYMKNNRIMYVEDYEKGDKWVTLKFKDGGKIHIKKGIIDRFEKGKQREEEIAKKSKSTNKLEDSRGRKDAGRSSRHSWRRGGEKEGEESEKKSEKTRKLRSFRRK